jgi:hypothetical protein
MMPRLIRQLFSSFLLLGIVRGYKNRTSLMKIKAAQTYVLGVQKTRLFCLAIFFMTLSLVFLVNGLSLIQASLFTYSMWSSETKSVAALILGGVEFFGAIIIFIYLFREETWSKFSGIRKVVDLIVNEKEKSNV